MFLTFPVEPNPSTVEIITEAVYASSTSLNGRSFAEEFVRRRRLDAQFGAAPAPAPKQQQQQEQQPHAGGSAAGQSANDGGFKVVGKKGKRRN
ncbi:MAG: hypothetical protein BJ554DRAFT_3151 [Olpidium bornovanus]|uniref:Uncharacterized protein n=1 Tax=Olpidium bornovanus TaxID=278681 RepID=A0A8H7ZPH8_9FUNG|nr:MAG: hypothetical protein BJ554DRAFT_3151 [Olpidium bornovanus]